MSNLTSEQVDAITYAYMDICATDAHLNGSSSGYDGMAAIEIGEAVKLTREDLEDAFPFLNLMEGVDDE